VAEKMKTIQEQIDNPPQYKNVNRNKALSKNLKHLDSILTSIEKETLINTRTLIRKNITICTNFNDVMNFNKKVAEHRKNYDGTIRRTRNWNKLLSKTNEKTKYITDVYDDFIKKIADLRPSLITSDPEIANIIKDTITYCLQRSTSIKNIGGRTL
jgi:hypothetical protein